MAFGRAVDRATADRIVGEALDLGLGWFDCGNTYSGGEAERVLGAAAAAHGRRRCVIASKVYFPWGPEPDQRGLSGAAVARAIDASLARLGVDHVDLYIAHRWDAEVPLDETLCALDTVVRQGKTTALGASSMWAWQFERALTRQADLGLAPYQVMQAHLNLLYREEEREMLPLCADWGVAVSAWSPLARGVLAGAEPADQMAGAYLAAPGGSAVMEAVGAVSRRLGRSGSEVALAWLVARGVAPVIGVRTVAELQSAARALELHLEPADVAELEAGYRPQPVLGHGDGLQRPPARGDA